MGTTTKLLLAIPLSGLFLIVAFSFADDSAIPTSIFQSRNLTQNGFWLLLPNEASVHDGVWALKQSDESLRSEAAGRRDAKFALDTGRKNLDALEDQYLAAANQYKQAVDDSKNIDKKDPQRYNQSIQLQNELSQRCETLYIQIDKQERAIEDLKAREETVEDSRGRYISLVMDIGTKAESVAAAYDLLAKDATLTAAIAQANQTAQPPLRLGPTTSFADDLKFIRERVKQVITGTVPVQKTRSGGLVVQAVINGKITTPMIWDSGADEVTLNAATGKALGLNAEKYRTVRMIVADGRTVDGKALTLDSIRLGAFTLKNVDCYLLPDIPGTRAANLLGDTFQSHFLSRLDQRSGQLQLTPIDPAITQGPVAELLPKIKPDANPGNPDLARNAAASSDTTLDGYDPAGAIDGIIDDSPKHEWASSTPTGSITLTWPDQLIVSTVKLWDRQNKSDHILTGQIVFDDDSTQPFAELPTDGSPLTIHFRPKYIHWLRIEIQSVSPNTHHPGFAEIAAFR